jgi:hypothetical protein
MSGNERSISSLARSISDESPVMQESAGEEIGYISEPQDERAHYEGEVQAEPSNYLREVNIRPLDSGYFVKVGCQSVAVETTETLLKALGEYLNNPDSFERAWNKNKNRSKL